MVRLIIIVVAVIAGLGAGWLAWQATLRPAAEAVVIEVPSVDVLVSSRDILRGARLTQDMLTWAPWPEDRLKENMILRSEQPNAVSEVDDRVLRSNVYSGEPLRREHLARGDGGFLSLVLQPGTRAIGVKITDEKTAGGFILPNDRVDVLHTVIRDFDGDGTATGSTRTILTNVRVLAIGQTSFDTEKLAADTTELSSEIAPADNGTTLTGQTATLEVTTEQAEALLSAAASGQLSLALRASEDFGLSGLGDLATIEGPKNTARNDTQSPVEVQVTVADGKAESYTPKREVTIIAAGKSRQVITEAEEVNP